MKGTENCIIIFLKTEVEFALIECDKLPLSSFSYKGQIYNGHIDSGFNGFYDWLRAQDGEVLGVEYFADGAYDDLINSIHWLPNVEVDFSPNRHPIIRIYFSSRRDYDELQSDDQEFGCNWMFQARSGEFALSFNGNNVSAFLEGIRETIIT